MSVSSAPVILSTAAAAELDSVSSSGVHQLLPGTASACILRHLSKHDKQQFSLACKHTHVLAVATIQELCISHRWMACKHHNATFPNCTSILLRPRTMDELSKMSSALLLHELKHLPQLSGLELDLKDVFDKHCDISLVIKSICLHTTQLTSLTVGKAGMLTAKAVAAMAEMPLLSALTLKGGHGFEPGALAPLSSMKSLAALYLEAVDGAINLENPAVRRGSVNNSSNCTSTVPDKLDCLLAADDSAMVACANLISFTAVNLGSCVRPIESFLAAVASSAMPRLTKLVLTDIPDLPATSLDLLSGICSLQHLCLAGWGPSGTVDLAKLSTLSQLTLLITAPQQPPALALMALAKGCSRLCTLGIGLAPMFMGTSMASVTKLLLSASPCTTKDISQALSGYQLGAMDAGGGAVDLSRLSVDVDQQHLSAVDHWWPGLRDMEVVGWSLHPAAMTTLKQLTGLTSLKLQGDPLHDGLHARRLLPMLDIPTLQRLVLLDLADLTDDLATEELGKMARALPAVRELHLGSTSAPCAAADQTCRGSPAPGSAHSSSAQAPCSLSSNGSAVAAHSSGRLLLTDKGLAQLSAFRCLHHLALIDLPGITLAGIKALVQTSHSIQRIDITRCPAVCAAPQEVLAKAAVAAPGRAVDLWVT